jgi:uncharacterized protein
MSEILFLPSDLPVTHIQTHSSHVFLQGDKVVKIKKPVDFSFLDYSTLERRKMFCEREVALNRRFSPEVYLEVRPLYRREDGALGLDVRGEIAEWAVIMKRLPQEAMLALRLERGDILPAEMTALADLLSAFYRSAGTTPEISAFGSVEQIRENTEENFETTLDFGTELLPDDVRKLLRQSNQRFLEDRADLLSERVSEGRILDGHGDLKPENLFLTDTGPVVTDCIEFNERFRYGDVLCDLGYLTMGLRAAGREDLRQVFLNRYWEVGEPDYPEDLLAYYEVYRAVVKGKIEGYRARQAEVPAKEREEARRMSNAHFLLARDIVIEAGL